MAQDQNRAAVVMLKGHGEERLRQAIAQGLVREDLQKDFEEVLKQVEEARNELKFAQFGLSDARKSLSYFQKTYYEALQAKQREEARAKKFESAKMIALAFGSMFIIVLLCMMICRMIFG